MNAHDLEAILADVRDYKKGNAQALEFYKRHQQAEQFQAAKLALEQQLGCSLDEVPAAVLYDRGLLNILQMNRALTAAERDSLRERVKVQAEALNATFAAEKAIGYRVSRAVAKDGRAVGWQMSLDGEGISYRELAPVLPFSQFSHVETSDPVTGYGSQREAFEALGQHGGHNLPELQEKLFGRVRDRWCLNDPSAVALHPYASREGFCVIGRFYGKEKTPSVFELVDLRKQSPDALSPLTSSLGVADLTKDVSYRFSNRFPSAEAARAAALQGGKVIAWYGSFMEVAEAEL